MVLGRADDDGAPDEPVTDALAAGLLGVDAGCLEVPAVAPVWTEVFVAVVLMLGS